MKPGSYLALAARLCGSCVFSFLLWTVWLGLIVALGIQGWLAFHPEVALPDAVLRSLEERLAASQVTARFGKAVFDRTGNIVIQDIQLFSNGQPTPLITARGLCASVAPWPLLVGDLRIREIRLTGATLHLPAMFSPSGNDENVIDDLDGVFHQKGTDYVVDACSFRLAGVSVTARGAFRMPAQSRQRSGDLPVLDLVLREYLSAGKKIAAIKPQLEVFAGPTAKLVLTPSDEHGAIVDVDVLVESVRAPSPITAAAVRARTRHPLLGTVRGPLRIVVEAASAGAADGLQVDRLRVDLEASLSPDWGTFTPQSAQISAARVSAFGVRLANPSAKLKLSRLPRLDGEIAAGIEGAPVSIRGNIDIKAGNGTLAIDTELTPELLKAISSRIGLATAKWVTLREPASASASIDLGPGWKPVLVEGDLSLRNALVHGIPITAASGHVRFSGSSLEVSGIKLIQGENAARGSYTMDTATRDYRFLLRGWLRPLDISPWFTDWWPGFWKHFDFTKAPAAAEVDVRGRWGSSEYSSVFCQADAPRLVMRGVSFDRVRTLLYYEPHHYRIYDFSVEQGSRSARGVFDLVIDPDHPAFRTLEFTATSTLDTRESGRLYGPAGTAIAAPYEFSEPPLIRASGHLDGPHVAGNRHSRIDFTVSSHGRCTIRRYPLDDLSFTAAIDNDDLVLKDIASGFAGGALRGGVHLWDHDNARRLAFDATLDGADLAKLVGVLDEVSLDGKPAPADRPKSKFLEHAGSSHVNASLKAEGPYGQPYGFRGDGTVSVAGRELGEVHLLGLLSELLKKTLLNFTSLRLDAAQANFRLEGNKLAFSQIKVTGPSTAIDARGDYFLDSKTLDIKARVFPFLESRFVLFDVMGALLAPLSNVLELKLTGPYDKPSWAFAYGPTSFLRSLTKPLNGSRSAAPGTETSGSETQSQQTPETKAAPPPAGSTGAAKSR